ncbi:MAG: iron-sulfur protein [Candidatus Heimdallarchaeota archaeon]|nr:iron-sulfur protein [Candidatus Heimdallarchaeota archaeon]
MGWLKITSLKIVVLNGSPKGPRSITQQYVKYIQTIFPEHDYEYIPIAQKLPAIEKNSKRFNEIIEAIQDADGIIWAFPVYYLLVNSNYKRFIELIFERGVEKAFLGKYAASLSTSIKFHDHIAHNYIRAISEDLQTEFFDSASFHMDELLSDDSRKQIDNFAKNFFDTIIEKRVTTRYFPSLEGKPFEYQPTKPDLDPIHLPDKRIVIITDAKEEETNLQKMIQQTTKAFTNEVEVYNLHEVEIISTCQGCLQCAYDFNCVFKEKDEFTEFCEQNVKQADVLIFAGVIKDRFLSARWKMFMDRYFYNNHTPTLQNKQIGFLISGPFSKTGVLREQLLSFVEGHRANPVGFVTDEVRSSKKLDEAIESFARKTAYYAQHNYFQNTFRGVAGIKIFRDELLGGLKTVFRADHHYYKKHGLYRQTRKQSFRQKIFNKVLAFLVKLKGFRDRMYPQMVDYMVRPYEQKVKEIQEQQMKKEQ